MLRRASLRASLAQARMQVQRAAAALSFRDHHFAAVLLQHPHGGLVEAREGYVGDAPRQKRHAIPPLALGRKGAPDLAEEERRLGRRRQLQQIARTGPAVSVEPSPRPSAFSPLNSIQVQHRSRDREQRRAIAAGGRRRSCRSRRASHPRRTCASNLGARVFHHAPVRDAGRAGRFAAAAGQAQADVLAGRIRVIGAPFATCTIW